MTSTSLIAEFRDSAESVVVDGNFSKEGSESLVNCDERKEFLEAEISKACCCGDEGGGGEVFKGGRKGGELGKDKEISGGKERRRKW